MSAPLVLLHGFTGTPAAFDEVRRRLQRPCHAWALTGHGPGADAPDWDGEIARLAARIEALGEPVHLVGYSLGGRTALGLIVAFPALFRRATLIGANPGLGDPEARAARRSWEEGLARQLETDGLRAFVDAWEALPLWASQASLPADVRDRQRRGRLSHDPAGLAASLRRCGLGVMPDLRASLSSVDVPVDLVVGGLDAKFRALSAAMADAMPHAEVRVVDDVGHNVVLEAPGPLASLLRGS